MISHHPAHAGTHCRREPFQSAYPLPGVGRVFLRGGFFFHALNVAPSAAGRIPPRVDGEMYSTKSKARCVNSGPLTTVNTKGTDHDC